MNWINAILHGALLGGYYAILASGLSFLFGVMRIVNVAHGSLTMLAAYVVLSLLGVLRTDMFVAVALAAALMAVFGGLLDRVVLQRSAGAGELVPILATFGLSIVIDNALFAHYGADAQSLAPNIGNLAYASWHIGSSVYVSWLDTMTFGSAVAILGGLQWILRRTPLGRAIRATASDSLAAELIGIDARQVYSFTAAISFVLVTLAALFFAMRASFTPYAGEPQLIFAFETVVIGGIGSLWGTLLGGIVLGVSQNVGGLVDPSGFLIAGHAVFLAVLMLRFAEHQPSLRKWLQAWRFGFRKGHA